MSSIVFCCAAPLASGVDTVRAMHMHVNTEFRSLPIHLFTSYSVHFQFVPEMTCTWNYVKMHVSAGILVNTVAFGLSECKQLIKKMDSILVHSSLMFLRLSVMNVNQEKSTFVALTDLFDLIYTVKTMQCYFTFDYSTSIIDLSEKNKALFI